MPGLEHWIKKGQDLEASSIEARLESPNSILDEQPLIEKKESESIEGNPLWDVLVETVESEILFSNRLAYVRQKIATTQPNITPEELTDRAGFPLGVSMVILRRLREEK